MTEQTGDYMNLQAKWMWYYGDYEIYHSNLLNARREAYGNDYPAFITYPDIHKNIGFLREYEFDEPTLFRVKANGKFLVLFDGEPQRATDGVYVLPEGKHLVVVYVCNVNGLPAVYIYGDRVVSDEGWNVSDRTWESVSVGCVPEYTSPDDNVEIFPFQYERMDAVEVTDVPGGKLYDFGKEVFGYLYINGISEVFSVFYGESIAEALDTQNAVLMEKHIHGADVRLRQRAFRYIFIQSVQPAGEVYMELEYLPMEDIGSFSCDDENVKMIFDICAYTLHLNSREFYLDGIKRDRWVWAGDAYQSFMVNPYLYFDREIIKRTILSLLGSMPYRQHINTINDYSFYLIIAVYDYWFLTADDDFVRKVYQKVKALYDFCVSRLDENGFVCERPGDWIFIDWADSLDKEGPHCVEQILLWQATRCVKKIALICGNQAEDIIDENVLRNKIYAHYYNKEAGGFFDSFQSGKQVLNRHQNILALLYDFTSKEESERIVEKILLNEKVPQITTPYFKFFELMALCKNHRVEIAQKYITSYWGGMQRLGATTFWEEYSPAQYGKEHYEMYNEPYGKSLCHAWGSGPICFLGKYVAGVRPTSAGYATWEVRPVPGLYQTIHAVVPLNGGKVQIDYEKGKMCVLSNCTGGVLYWNGKQYPIQKDIPVCIS